jgi:tRNA(fMet)-specific endonuclease VapC
MTLLLDTSVCIPLINRTDPSLADRLLATDPGSVVLCSVVKAELHFGAHNSARVAENLDRVERFCGAFDSLPFDDAAAARYGSIRAQLRREGRPIGANDMLIASIALSGRATLVTRNAAEFERVPGLRVAVW